MDWNLTEDVILSGGPIAPVNQGEKIRWNKHTKQGVHFFVQRNESLPKLNSGMHMYMPGVCPE